MASIVTFAGSALPLVVAALALMAVSARAQYAGPIPLLRAHAHNDQENGVPLLDAVNLGFCNVETDTNLIDGELIVGHTCGGPIVCDKRLAEWYLDPLVKAWQTNSGVIHAKTHTLEVCREFSLMIDMKTGGDEAFNTLHNLLGEYNAQYPGFLTTYSNMTKVSQGAVTVILSGSRPGADVISTMSPRYLVLDGRILENENDDWPNTVYLWQSQDWASMFDVVPEFPFSEETCSRITEVSQKAHAKGQRIRFWSIRAIEEFWNELVRCGCDLINFDNYARGAEWLLA